MEMNESDNNESVTELSKENGSNETLDELLQLVVEFDFQNEYLKSQFDVFKNLALEPNYNVAKKDNDMKELHEQIETLNRELMEEKQTRGAAEEALKHLRAEYSEADSHVKELSTKLAEAEQKMEQEVKVRDEKCSELDTKLNRLHKRAKQRIQEVQKEKDEVEAQFREANEKADRTFSELTALQQELERSRKQANEALKALDIDRHQLRTANNKLRENIEELRGSLAPKESAIEALQELVSEKDQILEDMQKLVQAAEEKGQASVSEVTLKLQKNIDNLEAQIADLLAEGTKASDTISSLRDLVAEKETKIAEIEAASSGEVVRLKAASESIKGELIHLKKEHEKEKESWENATQLLKGKLEIAENNCIHSEIEVAKIKSQLDSALSAHSVLLNRKDSDLQLARQEVIRVESEFASYKVRAHSLLQRKDAEIASARDNDQVKALEEAIKEVEKELVLACSERDKAIQDMNDALSIHVKELLTRDEALSTAQQDIKNMEIKFNSALSTFQTEKETWEKNMQNVEETWKLRCETLEAQKAVSSDQNLRKEFEDFKRYNKKMKEEHDSFRDLADKMIMEKDEEISRLVNDYNKLCQSLESKPMGDYNFDFNTVTQKIDAQPFSPSSAEQQILILARQQAQREEELSQSQRHIIALQDEIEELERENRLHGQQEAMLKEELRNMERMKKREGVDLTYLKNVILKLLETGEVEVLLPVVGMLLQFSPEEILKCQQAYKSANDNPSTPGSASDTTGSGLSLFSRFAFS